jgi:syndecan 1
MAGTVVERNHVDRTEQVCADLCAVLFRSLPRSDQRRRGAEYMRGLLAAPGRKSIRKIAASVGGPATEQNLHHFIVSSTWDWAPVRQALTRYLVETLERRTPRAWTARPIIIPKTGERCPGVGPRYLPEVGQVVNAQQAVGVWMVSEDRSFPVNWRLQAAQPDRPDEAGAGRPVEASHGGPLDEAMGEFALEAVLEVAEDPALPRLPLVMDASGFDAASILRRLRAADAPFLVRIDPALSLMAAPAGAYADARPAERLLGGTRELRRPVVWTEQRPGQPPRRHLVAGTAVRTTDRGRASVATPPGSDLLLLGIGPIGTRWPGEYWLTDQTDLPPLALVRLSRLIGPLHQDFDAITEQAGICDFAGRSYNGWHRHATLASAAHAVNALTGPAPTPSAPDVRPSDRRDLREIGENRERQETWELNVLSSPRQAAETAERLEGAAYHRPMAGSSRGRT